MAISTYVIGAGIVVAALIVVPFALPSSKTVARSSVIDAPPAAIYAMIASTEGFQRFNPYRDTDPNLKLDPFGPAEGLGAGFRFEGKDGKGSQTIIAAEQDHSVTMQIDLGAMGQPVQTFTLTPDGEKTLVEWQVKSDFGLNPIGRVFGLFMDGMLGPIYERGLANLAKTIKTDA